MPNPHTSTDAAERLRAYFRAQIEQLDAKISELSAQRNALAHLVHSEVAVAFLSEIQAAVRAAHPGLNEVLADVLREATRPMRTSDLVVSVVKDRGIAVTESEVRSALHVDPRFQMNGKGWWRLIEAESLPASAACAGGAG